MADSSMDMKEHKKTYQRFMGLTKFSIIAVVVIMVAMAMFLV
jgi:Bacterial aa3 type cytochrome c oxidase subunit IV